MPTLLEEYRILDKRYRNLLEKYKYLKKENERLHKELQIIDSITLDDNKQDKTTCTKELIETKEDVKDKPKKSKRKKNENNIVEENGE